MEKYILALDQGTTSCRAIPVSATAMWNSLQDYGALQVRVDLL